MQRFGLLIGCNSGRGQQPLHHAEEDVDKVYRMLRRHAGWDTSRLVLLHGNVTAQDIIGAIQQLRSQVRSDDFVLVYYAGHAGDHNREYSLLLPNDYFPASQMVSPFAAEIALSGSLTILDTCFSERSTTNALELFLRALSREREQSSARNGITGVRAVFAASAATRPAKERSSGGVLTTAFIHGCEHIGADTSLAPDGVISLNILGAHLRKTLQAKGQEFKEVVYGGSYDIQSLYAWRRNAGNRRPYAPTLVMFPEETRRWHSSISQTTELASSYWTTGAQIQAIGAQGRNVTLVKVDPADHVVNEVAELPIKARSQGIKLGPHGGVIAVASEEGKSVSVFSTDTCTRLRDYKVDSERFVLTSDNMLVTYESSDGAIRVWPIESRQQYVAETTYPSNSQFRHMRSSPSGKKIAAGGSADGKVRLWSLSDVSENARKPVQLPCKLLVPETVSPVDDQFMDVRRVAFSHTGELVAAGYGGSGRVRAWRLDDSHSPLSDVAFARHENFITALEFDPTDSWLGSGCGGGRVYVTALDRLADPLMVWEASSDSGPDERITALSLANDGEDRLLVAGTSGGRIVICLLADGKVQRRQELANASQRGPVYCLELLVNEDQPVQVIVAARHGTEYWDFAWN